MQAMAVSARADCKGQEIREIGRWLRSCCSVVVAIVLVVVSVCPAQQTGPLSPQAVTVRDKIRSLPAGRKVTILMKRRHSYHGDLQKADEMSFSMYEVDQQRVVTIRYEDVKKVRRGYGGYNSVCGCHVDPLRSRIAAIAVGAVLLGILIAVAAAKG